MKKFEFDGIELFPGQIYRVNYVQMSDEEDLLDIWQKNFDALVMIKDIVDTGFRREVLVEWIKHPSKKDCWTCTGIVDIAKNIKSRGSCRWTLINPDKY